MVLFIALCLVFHIGATLSNMYVVTAFYNPGEYSSMLNNFYRFEQHMKFHKVNLVVIECLYRNQSDYKVTKRDNPNHI